MVFKIVGDKDESLPVRLHDRHRPCFERGQDNAFVVSYPEGVGDVSYVQIWHDNSGVWKIVGDVNTFGLMEGEREGEKEGETEGETEGEGRRGRGTEWERDGVGEERQGNGEERGK